MYFRGEAATLERYRERLLKFTEQSHLVQNVDGVNTAWHSPPDVLYTLVSQGRNDALHHGAAVRHLTQHAIELALLFEDALMNGDAPAVTLRDIMVRCPVTAEEWQPVGFVRQVMLTSSFSFLPIRWDERWKVISDVQLAAFLRAPGNQRSRRLGRTVKEAATPPLTLVIEDATVGAATGRSTMSLTYS